MNVAESVRFALTGVLANKMRSILTTLGILIGIASVIILLAVGAGTSNAIKDQIAKLGTNILAVTPVTSGGGRSASGSAVTGTSTTSNNLTVADMNALTNPVLAPDIQAAAPVVSAQSVTASYQGATHSVATFIGSTPDYFGISNDSLASGAYFTSADETAGSNKAVIGNTVAQALVGDHVSSAVGQTIALNGQNFLVTGVLTTKGATGANDPDDIVVIPMTAAQDQFTGFSPSLSSITLEAKSANVMNQAQNEVQMILDSRHNVTAANPNFTIRNQAQILTTATSTTSTLTVLLGAVAAISLLVGGIGVMNIMLVTVTERTREIGIRKAIGASRGSIVSQFLIESLIISVIGGLLGVIVGFIGSAFPILGTTPQVQWWTVWLSVIVSAAIGLIFGIYPANKAAKLRPIDALRFE